MDYKDTINIFIFFFWYNNSKENFSVVLRNHNFIFTYKSCINKKKNQTDDFCDFLVSLVKHMNRVVYFESSIFISTVFQKIDRVYGVWQN